MKDSDMLPIQAPATATKLFGKGRYKLFALLAVVLLACWSMLTGTATLKSSSGTDDTDAAIRSDFDVLEVEERERVVRKMWEVYSHNREIRLPEFWRSAFEAAYEELAGDASRIREDAISEIARMSMQRLLDLETYPRNSKNIADEKNHLSQGKAKPNFFFLFYVADYEFPVASLKIQSYLTAPIVVLLTCSGGNHSADHIANMAQRQKSVLLKEQVHIDNEQYFSYLYSLSRLYILQETYV